LVVIIIKNNNNNNNSVGNYKCSILAAKESIVKPAQRHKHTKSVQIHKNKTLNKQKNNVAVKINIE
jgi:hypothetical protein